MRAIERSIVHYGDNTLFIADQMRKGGLGYASAVAMEEATLLDFNLDQRRGSLPKLVAIYPKEGTFFSDSPFIVLDADWVTPELREGALAFQRFLAEQITPEVAARGGFRPADLEAEPVAPITAENGVDPEQPERELELPEPRVLALLKRTWREDRKPANVLLVLDTSGSMTDESRLENAKQGLNVFLAQVAPQDRVGLTTFSDQITPLVAVGPFRENEAGAEADDHAPDRRGRHGVLRRDRRGLRRGARPRRPRRPHQRRRAAHRRRRTPTPSASSTRSWSELERQGDSATQVRVFTIAYSVGPGEARKALERIAEASGGNSYPGDPENIEAVYRSISSFF